MDAIRIQIVRGCDAQGQGGTVVDDATGVLGSLPDGSLILDVLAAAMADAYGLYSYADPNSPGEVLAVSPLRNISTRMRLYGQEILSAYAAKVASQQAAQLAGQQVAAALQSLTIVENLEP